jgi:hypothetical protein
MSPRKSPAREGEAGVLLAVEPGFHSAKALQLQTLATRGLVPVMAEVLAPLVWGGAANF